MGETAGPQIEGNSPSQTASASGSQEDNPSASQMGERSRSHMGETNSLSLNSSGGKVHKAHPTALAEEMSMSRIGGERRAMMPNHIPSG